MNCYNTVNSTGDFLTVCVHDITPTKLSCRYYVRELHQDETSQVELFLNSVPILSSLTRDEKMMLVDALEEQVFAPAAKVINQVCCLSQSSPRLFCSDASNQG